jgi:hypothetical protein
MINFCTLFDSNYLSRGLALYHSLRKISDEFHLYVFAFDEKCYNYLLQAGLSNLTVISLREFEDKALLEIKPDRSPAEYCWTCTPCVILYCLEKYNLSSCTYIDADMIFYQDPKILVDEMGDKDIMITEHRYTKDYDVSDTHGIYCVQFMCVKNTEQGILVLKWWRERCIEWCYAKLENGKFGDQKYLDDWLTRFKGIHVLEHRGGGIAPWNVQQFEIENRDGKIMAKQKDTWASYPVIFFHFHGLKFYTNGFVSFCGSLYELDKKVKEIFYVPYIKQLLKIENDLRNQQISFNVSGAKTETPGKGKVLIEFLRDFGAMIRKGKASPFKPKNYNFKKHYHFYKLERFK